MMIMIIIMTITTTTITMIGIMAMMVMCGADIVAIHSGLHQVLAVFVDLSMC